MKTTHQVSPIAKVLAATFSFGTLFAYVGWKHRELSGANAGFEGAIPAPLSNNPEGMPSESPSPAPSIGSAESQVLPHPQLILGSTKSYTFVEPPMSVEALMEPFPNLSTVAVPDPGSPPITVGTTVQPTSLHLMGTKSGTLSLSVPASSPPLHMGSTKTTVGVVSPQLMQTVVNPAPDPFATPPLQSPVNPSKTDKHTEEVARLFKEGLGYFYLGQFENACASFNKTLAMDPHNVAACRQLEKSEHELDKDYVSARDQTPKAQPPTLHLGSTKSIDSLLSPQLLKNGVPPAPDPFGATPAEPAKQAK